MRLLILSLLPHARVVIVPMGPKIFCSICFALQRILGNEVSIWRASGHTLKFAKDVDADGNLTSYLLRRERND